MALSDIVNVTVVVQNPGITQPGFGVPMIVSHSAAWAERTRTYNSTLGIAEDFPVNSPEYLAASKIFGQSPRPPLLMIGRAVNKPIQQFDIVVTTPLTATTYSVRIAIKNGSAWTSQTASFTSVTNLNDDIATGLKAAIDALAAPVVTGAGATLLTSSLSGASGSKIVRLVSNTAGNFYGCEVLDIQKLNLYQDGTDPGIVADLTAIALASNAWYGLITLFNSAAIVTAAAGWVETVTKLYNAALQDSKVATVAYDGTNTDVAANLRLLGYARTAGFYHPANDEFADAAEMGRFFPIAPGGDNWRLKSLSGVTAQSFTQTQTVNMDNKYCNYYYVLGGSANVIGGNGKVFANEYIDIIRGIDWWTSIVVTNIVNLLIQQEKVPYDDDGITQIENQVIAANRLGVSAKLIAPDPAPVVTVPLARNIPTSEKIARVLNNLNTNWTAAGAINKVNVNAQISF